MTTNLPSSISTRTLTSELGLSEATGATLGLALAVALGVAVAEGVAETEGLALGLAVTVALGVAVAEGLAEALGEAEGFILGVALALGDAVGLAETLGVAEGDAEMLGLGVTAGAPLTRKVQSQEVSLVPSLYCTTTFAVCAPGVVSGRSTLILPIASIVACFTTH